MKPIAPFSKTNLRMMAGKAPTVIHATDEAPLPSLGELNNAIESARKGTGAPQPFEAALLIVRAEGSIFTSQPTSTTSSEPFPGAIPGNWDLLSSPSSTTIQSPDEETSMVSPENTPTPSERPGAEGRRAPTAHNGESRNQHSQPATRKWLDPNLIYPLLGLFIAVLSILLAVSSSFSDRTDRLDDKLDSQKDSLHELDKRAEVANLRLAAVEKRLDSVDARLETLGTQVNAMSAQLGTLGSQIGNASMQMEKLSTLLLAPDAIQRPPATSRK